MIKAARKTVMIAVTALLMASGAASAGPDCSSGYVDLRGNWGQARFAIDLADDPQERATGLMHVEQMPRGRGMLFVYERPQRVAFWMENTLIPLDMIFIDAAGVVQKVHADAVPMDRTTIDGGDNIFAVLEINAGLSELMGISQGTQVRHPSFAKEQAEWAC